MSRTDVNFGEAAVHLPQKGRDSKSVGCLLPGLAAKIEDSRLWLKFPPGGKGTIPWSPDPEEAETAPDGLIYLRHADLA